MNSPLDTFRSLNGFQQTGENQYQARCPAHDDRTASLSIGTGQDGKALVHCHAGCSTEAVVTAMGITTKDLFPANGNGSGKRVVVATYDYRDLDGTLLYQVVRFKPKEFQQRRPAGGGWDWSVKGIKRVPYRLPELKAADSIFITEGEKDADALQGIGLTATCNAGGAGKWPDELDQYFRPEQEVVIIPDNDEPGRKHAELVAGHLHPKVESVKILRLEGLPEKGDVSDWLQGRDPEGAAEELCKLAEGAPEWDPGAEEHQGKSVAVEPSMVFRPANDIMAEPRTAEIVSGIAWANCLTTFTAESGTGKTFCLLSIAAAVSDDSHWFDRQVSPGSVAYVSFEGDAIGVRLRAIREVQGRELRNVYVVRASQPLSPMINKERVETPSPGELILREALENLRDSLSGSGLPPIKLIIIDTIRASMSGSEDSSETVSAYLRAARRVASSAPGAAVILVHHTGWQDGDNTRKRERGSSAFRGNIDGTVYLERPKSDAEDACGRLILQAVKARDCELAPPLYLVRRCVTLTATAEEAATGRPVTSCVIERDGSTPQDRQAAEAAEHQEIDLRILRVIAERSTTATSKDSIRLATGLKRDLVYEAIERLIYRNWIRPPERQRRPYTVTDLGMAALEEAKGSSHPESSRAVPSSRPE